MKKLLVALAVGLGFQAFAGVSLLTSAIVIGGDRVYDLSLSRALDRPIREVASSLGEVCILTEHFYYRGGLGYARVLLLKSSLESAGWTVEEVIPYGPSSSGRLGVWYMTKRRESVLALLYEFRDGSAGVVSFCSL
jgi:RsiW-degrading membrane proteinase PrsW (M82 family)